MVSINNVAIYLGYSYVYVKSVQQRLNLWTCFYEIQSTPENWITANDQSLFSERRWNQYEKDEVTPVCRSMWTVCSVLDIEYQVA